MENEIEIITDLPVHLRKQVVEIAYDAFAPKMHHLELFTDSEEQVRRVCENGLDFAAALYAVQRGSVVGVTGLHYADRQFTRLKWAALRAEFGWLGGVFRKLVAYIGEPSRVKEGELKIDAIAVHRAARGQGIGTLMMNAVFDYAAEHGFDVVKLEVIDTNPQARRLYERLGFEAVRTQNYGFITRRAGFTASTLMVKRVQEIERGSP